MSAGESAKLGYWKIVFNVFMLIVSYTMGLAVLGPPPWSWWHYIVAFPIGLVLVAVFYLFVAFMSTPLGALFAILLGGC